MNDIARIKKPVSNQHGNVKAIELDLGKPNPKQKLFYESRTLYTAYGGAKGGGKTHAVRTKAVLGATHYAGIKILIMRRTYPELQKNHIDPMLKLVPNTIASYNGQLRTMYFINGSTITFGHYQGGTSAENEYQGQEYDWVFIDEATQFTEHEFRMLGGLLRGTNDIPKRMYLTCNPGGVGHSWVKRLFIDRKFIEDKEEPERSENPNDYSFIFASVEDNEVLMKKSPGYLQMLSSLPENVRRAYRYGDWSALGGNYFPEFSEKRHVIKSFTPPPNWSRYRAIDYGLDMLACGWFAVDENGRAYMYRELKVSNLVVTEAAQMIRDCTHPNENILITFAPPDMWNRQKDSGKSMAELFMQSGVPIVKANNNRVQGWLQVKEFLKDMEDGKPGLYVTDNCRSLISDIQAIQADEKNPNDCAKDPHDITHITDMLRYFCISRIVPGQPADVRSEEPDDDEDGTDYSEYMTGGEVTSAYITGG